MSLNSHPLRAPSKNANPLRFAIHHFLSNCRPSLSKIVHVEADIPKRYTRYGSLVLLGPTFMTHSTAWGLLYGSLSSEEREALFRTIVNSFPDGVTHVAANAPIAYGKSEAAVNDEGEIVIIENVMRSPTGFLPLYGEFGPDGLVDSKAASPLPQDFMQAFWAETAQVRNIVQVWAPRWTMFSRGNISEKVRILQDGSRPTPFPGLATTDDVHEIHSMDVVDFYVGIGYFAFSYLLRGVHRVWGWDINGWSIEGLRRGCNKNGWGVKVVRITDDGCLDAGTTAANLAQEISSLDGTPHSIRCVAFQGDNRWAGKVMGEIDTAFRGMGATQLNVRHCNLGLLPSSQRSWAGALTVLNPRTGGWLHVHENADATNIQAKRNEVVQGLEALLAATKQHGYHVCCEHIENVKTYAPGVMHCVFDIKVQRL